VCYFRRLNRGWCGRRCDRVQVCGRVLQRYGGALQALRQLEQPRIEAEARRAERRPLRIGQRKERGDCKCECGCVSRYVL